MSLAFYLLMAGDNNEEAESVRKRCSMNQSIIHAIARKRPLLYHFTRMSNLASITANDRLLSAGALCPQGSLERRRSPVEISRIHGTATLNPHLRIADSMMEEGVTQEEFRSWLNRHVFFWPTARDCRKMLEVYRRREPDGRFCVLALDTCALLTAHYSNVRVTKYDSRSSPRFPHRCSYRKSPRMFLPLEQFMSVDRPDVPVSVGEIREVLVDSQVMGISCLLRTVFAPSDGELPSGWSGMPRHPLEEM